MPRSVTILAVAALTLFAHGADAKPAGVRVAPVTIAMAEGQNVGSFRVDNGRALPISFQIDAYAWTQTNGRDVLTPTRALAVAPSILEVTPGGERLVRVALSPTARDPEIERAFRLIIKELPTGASPAGRARILLELSIPVFATASGATPRLEVRRSEGALYLANEGRAHARVLEVRSDRQGAGAPFSLRYLLSGSSAPLMLPETARAAHISYLTLGASAPSEQVISLAPDPLLVASRRP
jgi:fimbrial chaperone protein